jgi:predicted ATPase
LYKKLSVKKLGQRPSDPFQLRVETSGPSANLPDVGYGISQALPIVVESVLATRGNLLLLQQPEVHLHPRAQAALGSFFVRQASSEKKDFVIETHSDYLVDRIRIEIAAGTIAPEQVSILFFDRSALETKVHQLTLDSNGNILGAPKNFRTFFLKEELRLLSRGA